MIALEEALKAFEVAASDIGKARSYQQKYGGQLERILVNMGSLAEENLPFFYGKLLDLPCIESSTASEWVPVGDAFEVLNVSFLLGRGWLPYDRRDDAWVFVTTNPTDIAVQQYLDSMSITYQRTVCSLEDFEALSRIMTTTDDESANESYDLSASEEDRLRELASEAPTVNLLNALITRGLRMRASDMHLEPVQGRYRVRFRVDGVLQEGETIPSRLQLALVSRLKILAGMDIAEKRRPQDGKIETRVANVDLDIRVSALPLNEGESVVLRFLRKDSVTYDFDVLGLSPDVEREVRQDLTHTAGVVLLTGPTGSGKTTTLYTFLNELNRPGVKIITLEDPVEYQLRGLNQVQVNTDIGFDFAAGLRSVVRQDPDIVMVGEIRDSETCRIAMQAALTGHLVFSTVHTNDAPSAFTRLIDLGVPEFLLDAALVSIIAQRLVRRLCEHCAAPLTATEVDVLCDRYPLRELASQFCLESMDIRNAVGCSHCEGSGYSGRFAVVEYLRCDDDLRALQKDELFLSKAKALNKQKGRRTLIEDGLLRVIQGATTLEEVVRVCG